MYTVGISFLDNQQRECHKATLPPMNLLSHIAAMHTVVLIIASTQFESEYATIRPSYLLVWFVIYCMFAKVLNSCFVAIFSLRSVNFFFFLLHILYLCKGFLKKLPLNNEVVCVFSAALCQAKLS